MAAGLDHSSGEKISMAKSTEADNAAGGDTGGLLRG